MQPSKESTQTNFEKQKHNKKKRSLRPSETTDVYCAACLDTNNKLIKLKKSSISRHYDATDFKISHKKYLESYPNTKFYEITYSGKPAKKKQKTIAFTIIKKDPTLNKMKTLDFPSRNANQNICENAI